MILKLKDFILDNCILNQSYKRSIGIYISAYLSNKTEFLSTENILSILPLEKTLDPIIYIQINIQFTYKEI